MEKKVAGCCVLSSLIHRKYKSEDYGSDWLRAKNEILYPK
jgi:hypothetical protein